MGLRVWERLLGQGGKRGGVAVGRTYDYRGVPVGDEGVVVALCIAERRVAGLGDGALDGLGMRWGAKRTSVAICFSRVSATG